MLRKRKERRELVQVTTAPDTDRRVTLEQPQSKGPKDLQSNIQHCSSRPKKRKVQLSSFCRESESPETERNRSILSAPSKEPPLLRTTQVTGDRQTEQPETRSLSLPDQKQFLACVHARTATQERTKLNRQIKSDEELLPRSSHFPCIIQFQKSSPRLTGSRA